MPWKKLDLIFQVLAWWSWVGVIALESMFELPDITRGTIPLSTVYPYYLSSIFLIPGGWYLIENREDKDHSNRFYLIYLGLSLSLLLFVVGGLFYFNNQLVLYILNGIWSLVLMVSFLAMIPINIICVRRVLLESSSVVKKKPATKKKKKTKK